MQNLTFDETLHEYMESIRQQFRICMNERNWTIHRIAIECELSYDGFCRIYYGRSKDINLSTLLRISHGLRKPIPVLLGLRDDEEPYISSNATRQLLQLIEKLSGNEISR